MKIQVLVSFLIGLSIVAHASVPEVVITHMTSSNGHATIAGRLASKPQGSVGVSVRNGNLIYSTLTDHEGRWGIVIRHQAVNVSAQSWNLSDANDRSESVFASVPQISALTEEK